jgi:uncharacterized protein (UPF0276 family)
MKPLDLLDGPFLGVGLGIDVHSESPDWRALLDKNRDGRAFDFFEVYTRGEAGAARKVRDAAGPRFPIVYHHEGLDPVYPAPPRADAVAAADENLRALGAPWCVEELAYRFLDGRYLDFFMPAVLTDESVDTAVENVTTLNRKLRAPVVPENPPYQLPVGPLHVLEYMAALSARAQVPVVLDLGHLYSFQMCRGLGPLEGLEALPLDRVIELHVAGASVIERDSVRIYEDLHGAAPILPEVLDMLGAVAPRCPHLRAVTIEVEDATTRGALGQAREVKRVLKRAGVEAPTWA